MGNWVVTTIRKRIAVCGFTINAERIRTVSINESTELGSVVTGFEVIEAGVGIEVVAPVAEGIDVGHVAGGGERFSPRHCRCKIKAGGRGTCSGGLKEDYAALGKESNPG